MFTSRAEYRLSLRADNADQRLTPVGLTVGCIGAGRAAHFTEKMSQLTHFREKLIGLSFSPTQMARMGFHTRQDGVSRAVYDMISQPEMMLSELKMKVPGFPEIPTDIFIQLSKESLYSKYSQRQQADIRSLQKDEQVRIPADFDYSALSGLSGELCRKLSARMPETILQASHIEGMTPAALILIISRIKRDSAVAKAL